MENEFREQRIVSAVTDVEFKVRLAFWRFKEDKMLWCLNTDDSETKIFFFKYFIHHLLINEPYTNNKIYVTNKRVVSIKKEILCIKIIELFFNN